MAHLDFSGSDLPFSKEHWPPMGTPKAPPEFPNDVGVAAGGLGAWSKKGTTTRPVGETRQEKDSGDFPQQKFGAFP